MDGAVATLIGGVAIAAITYVVSPWVKARLEQQRDNDPAMGWQTAVKEVKDTATKLERRVEYLEAELARLEDENAVKTATIARLEQVSREQGKMLVARDGRIGQLERVLHDAQISIPVPDPAVIYWLTATPSGGIAIL